MLVRVCAMTALVVSPCFASSLTSWERYAANPTPDNAKEVRTIAYSGDSSRERIYDDLRMLELQVVARDEEAVRLAFRLLKRTSDHYAELLSTMIGRLIRVDPRLFLRELQSNISDIERLDSLLCGFGDEYVDKFEAMAYETQARISSLQKVDDKGLSELRGKCVRELEDHLRLVSSVRPSAKEVRPVKGP